MSDVAPFDPATFDRIDAATLRWSVSANFSYGNDVIGARVAEMTLGHAPAVTAALAQAATRGMLGYPTADVVDATRAATARWYTDRYGWDVDPARVQPVADVITTLRIAIEFYSDPGAPVVVPTPTYMKFLTVTQALGREVRQVPLAQGPGGRYEFDLDGLRAALQPGAILLLCNPFNPVGRVFTRQELVAVSEVVEAAGARVFSDEVHAPIVYAGATHTPYATVSDAAAAHAVTGTSAAKAFNLAGAKCAQVIFSNDADAARWPQVAPLLGQGASTLGLVANTSAYDDGREWFDHTLDYLDGNRHELAALVAAELPGVRFRAPEGTFVGWLDCRELGLDDPETFFRQANVAVTDGRSCGTVGAGFVRFVFAMPRPLLREAVHRMGSAVRAR